MVFKIKFQFLKNINLQKQSNTDSTDKGIRLQSTCKSNLKTPRFCRINVFLATQINCYTFWANMLLIVWKRNRSKQSKRNKRTFSKSGKKRRKMLYQLPSVDDIRKLAWKPFNQWDWQARSKCQQKQACV